MRHGNGVMEWTKSGQKYTGEFFENKRQGKGTIVQANGQKYVGGFENDSMHGEGDRKSVV